METGVVVNLVYVQKRSLNILLHKKEDTVLETFAKQKKYSTTYLKDSEKKHYDLSQYFMPKQSALSQR